MEETEQTTADPAADPAEGFGAPPPEPFDGTQAFDGDDDASQAEQDDDAGGPPPPLEEHGGEDGTPLPPEGKDTNAGKRYVFASRSEFGPWTVVPEPVAEGEEREEGVQRSPFVVEGDDKIARLAALEVTPELKRAAEAGEIYLVTCPVGSWKPRKPKPPKPGWVV